MDPWTSPTIPYPVTPLDRGSGFVPSIAEPNGPAATQAFIAKMQHIVDYIYQKSPLIGRTAAGAQAMADLTYQKSSLVGRRGASAQAMVAQTYQKSSLVGRQGAAAQAMVSQTYRKSSLIGRGQTAGELYYLKSSLGRGTSAPSGGSPQSLGRGTNIGSGGSPHSGGNFSPTQQLINLSRTVSSHYRAVPAGATKIRVIPSTGYYLVS